MTLVELKVLLCELEDREMVLREAEARFAAGGRWAQRREAREQRHGLELRKAEVERRLKAMEAAS